VNVLERNIEQRGDGSDNNASSIPKRKNAMISSNSVPYMSATQFQTFMSVMTGGSVPRGELATGSSAPLQIARSQDNENNVTEPATQDQAAIREDIMKDFSDKELADQLETIQLLCNSIAGFKFTFEKDCGIRQDLIYNDKCRTYFKQKVRPVLRCFLTCCKKDINLFFSKHEESGRTKMVNEKRKLMLSKWKGCCKCASN
jgi:hypothetical protein